MAKIVEFKQIVQMAQSLFPCYVQDCGWGTNADGKREIHLIVGKKTNPGWDAKATSGPRSKKTEPDIRILFVRSGIEDTELQKDLLKIKKSLEDKNDKVDITNTVTPADPKAVSQDELADIAEKVAAGQSVDSSSDIDLPVENNDWVDAPEGAYDESDKTSPEESSSLEKRVDEAHQFIQTLADTVTKVNDNVVALAKKIDKLDVKEAPKKSNKKSN